MANVRVTLGHRSRIPGTRVGVQVNTFGMTKLEAGITGAAMVPILLEAGAGSYEEAYAQWPVLTGASRDSISLDVIEVADHRARVALQVGGEKLISDPRNKSHKDYAPFIEFNGTATAPAGIIQAAIYSRDSEIRQIIHAGIRQLIGELIS